MKVLVVGGGGREHTLTWNVRKSPLVDEVYCAPGNAGMAELAECVDIDATDIKSLSEFAKAKKIDLTVVGPEAPLVNGIVDEFEGKGLRIFGPCKQAALIEGSKIFAKRLMEKYQVPTGKAKTFSDYEEAKDYVETLDPPIVVKADGLAAGKGVTVALNIETANQALESCFVKKKFGEAGKRVIIEEYLEGEEVSLLAFTDGKTVLPMVPAQDYKRALDNDEGPNTGGMGSYSPVPVVSKEIYDEIVETILKPTILGLASEGIRYKGVLYGGLILTPDGPKVLEFNVRFGDPETQAILPRLESDLVEVMIAVVDGDLANCKLRWSDDKCVTVVVASGGYPENYVTGFRIEGLEEASSQQDVELFHAGTAFDGGGVVTAGGRVLNVSAKGRDFKQARERAYQAIGKIHFDGMHYRKDIALRAVTTGD